MDFLLQVQALFQTGAMQKYFWVTYVVAFCCLIKLPTRLSAFDNFIGTAVLSLFGFFLWPATVYAAIKNHVRRS